MPAKGWRDIILRLKDKIAEDNVSVVAAGVAFFGLLSVFPGIAAFFAIAGLVQSPVALQNQVTSLASLLPDEAALILRNQVEEVVSDDGSSLGFAAIFGLILALYSSSRAIRTLMVGMNIAYEEREERGMIALYLIALALTFFLIMVMLVGLTVTLIIPVILEAFGLPETLRAILEYGRWPILAATAMLALAVIYRFGPSRSHAKWRWVSIGAVLATVLWIAGSVGFSIYVRNFGSYNETYGALGGVIILLTWFWLSAFIVLLGAELNSEIEHQTEEDSTTGPPQPMGERGAVKADTVGEIP